MAPQLNFGSAESIADEMEIDPISQDALMRIAKGLQIANTGLAAAADAYNDLRARMYQGLEWCNDDEQGSERAAPLRERPERRPA